MHHYRLNLDPVPASRPRVSKWGTYYGKRHKAFRSAALTLLSELREQGDLPQAPLSGSLGVRVGFNVKRPKTSKLTEPRGDIDNYLKILLDCCTGYLWEDDVQIQRICSYKLFAEAEGYIDIWIKEEKSDGTTNFEVPQRGDGEPTPDDLAASSDEGFDFCAGGFVTLPVQPPGRED